jgi:hypothetical protein
MPSSAIDTRDLYEKYGIDFNFNRLATRVF